MTSLDQALAAHRAGNLDQAEALYRQILARNKRDFDALHMLGVTFAQRGRFDEAERLLHKAITLDAAMPPCLHHYANVLCMQKRYEAAIPWYDKAIAIAPRYAPVHSDRGNALRALGRFDEAIASYNTALASDPNCGLALTNLADALIEIGRRDEASRLLRRALALNANDAHAIQLTGHMASEHGDLHSALAHSRRALALKPDLASAYHTIGNALRDLGRLDEARDAYAKSITLDPTTGSRYLALAGCMKFTEGDPHLAAMESLAANAALTKPDRKYLDYALGKAYADVKDYRRSFQCLLAANAAKRAETAYNEAATMRYFDRIERIFSAELIVAKSGGGDPSQRPIFIIGMPRSGTTLVEQVLASHPAVHGAGELMALRYAARIMPSPLGSAIPYPDYVATAHRSALRRIGGDYLRQLAVLAPQGERVTDKLPQNFGFAGLIHLALPNAAIIHTVRDPIDTCLSCFSILFKLNAQAFSYDLGELGRYYDGYRRLMAHWQRVLPKGRILEVRYEDVVADLQGQARRILAHCGLPWDNRCLSFHETSRPVQTASAAQVRQPIYNNSVGRWRAYEEWLGPLLAEIGTKTS